MSKVIIAKIINRKFLSKMLKTNKPHELFRNSAFSFVEIIVLVGIIALFAAVAIPSILRAKLNANEKIAQANLQAVASACERYRVTKPGNSYPKQAKNLFFTNPAYCESGIFAFDGIDGYIITYSAGEEIRAIITGFDCGAKPIKAKLTGKRWFVIDETGVLRIDVNMDGIANASDTAIE